MIIAKREMDLKIHLSFFDLKILFPQNRIFCGG